MATIFILKSSEWILINHRVQCWRLHNCENHQTKPLDNIYRRNSYVLIPFLPFEADSSRLSIIKESNIFTVALDQLQYVIVWNQWVLSSLCLSHHRCALRIWSCHWLFLQVWDVGCIHCQLSSACKGVFHSHFQANDFFIATTVRPG